MRGLLPGRTDLLSPVVMVNLLGDVWQADGGEPNWNVLMSAQRPPAPVRQKHAPWPQDGPLHRAGLATWTPRWNRRAP